VHITFAAMKTLLVVYRLLSFILLPIAAILGFLDAYFLLVALANPSALLPVFAIACIVIYVFTSLSFLTKGILGGRQCNPSLRDWIRVNAIVSIIVSGLGVIEYITLIINKSFIGEVVKQAIQQQKIPAGFTAVQLEQMLLKFFFFFFLFSIVLLIHILMSFRLLRQYNYLFK
jgi:hypothetical protein